MNELLVTITYTHAWGYVRWACETSGAVGFGLTPFTYNMIATSIAILRLQQTKTAVVVEAQRQAQGQVRYHYMYCYCSAYLLCSNDS